ncbi:MAG: MFS transporter [Holosporales bacterium]|nr:MFS transporter [Holosporales bacterium]
MVIALLGFSCGLPLLLTASTLGYWMAQEKISLTKIGLMSIAVLPYTIKFLWAPLIDRLRLPGLTRWLGRRRAWLFLSQSFLIIFLFCLSRLDPAHHLEQIVIFVFLIAFFSATQDIVMLAYQVERLQRAQYGAGEAAGIFGYRLGILLAGAGAFYLASFLSWNTVYLVMTGFQCIGLITTLCALEPRPLQNPESQLREQKAREYLLTHPRLKGWRGPLLSWFYGALIAPFHDFIKQPAWLASLFIMLFYKCGDNLIGSMGNIYFNKLGFTNIEIANGSKIFGLWATILGGFIGGLIVKRYGMLKSLFWCGAFHGITALGFILLGIVGHNSIVFYLIVALDNITGGMRVTALFAYQMTLCSPSYAATQLALLTSTTHLGRVIFSSSSGWIVEHLGWNTLFWLATFGVVPTLMVIYYLSRIKKENLWFSN